MRARAVAFVAIAAAAVAAPLACVDLFHSTEFETLHDDAAVAPPDVVVPVADAEAGTKPLVDFCAWSSTEAKEHAARACAWLGACGGPLGETVFGPCMIHAMSAYDCELNPRLRPKGAAYALWSCLSDVKSCGDVEACLGAGATATCVAVVSGAFTNCAPPSPNEVRAECGRPQAGPPSALEPCVLFGKTCAILDESTSLCAGATKKACSPGLACDGTAAVDCRLLGSTLFDQGIECASVGGGGCVVDDAGIPACKPNDDSPDCDGGVAATCDDDGFDVVRSCVGGKAVSFNCAVLGARCDVTTKPVPGYDLIQACAERVDAGRCTGADDCRDGKLRSCAQGLAFEADCASLGLGACERINDGVLARCAPP